MNEQRYKRDHLQDYRGILISQDRHSGRFRMELKVEDNPVLKRSIEKIESTIELEFYHNYGYSTQFFHNIHTCPSIYSRDEKCHECEDMRRIYDRFLLNLERLQFGDTFRIKAALTNNDRSELPVKIQSFKDYERITVACVESYLRLDDTPAGIYKKYGLEQQKLQREREEAAEKEREKEREKAAQEEAAEKAKRRKIKEGIQQFFGKSPNINQIIATIVVTTIAYQILPRIFKYISQFFSPN